LFSLLAAAIADDNAAVQSQAYTFGLNSLVQSAASSAELNDEDAFGVGDTAAFLADQIGGNPTRNPTTVPSATDGAEGILAGNSEEEFEDMENPAAVTNGGGTSSSTAADQQLLLQHLANDVNGISCEGLCNSRVVSANNRRLVASENVETWLMSEIFGSDEQTAAPVPMPTSSPSANCGCDQACVLIDDCCWDYHEICLANTTGTVNIFAQLANNVQKQEGEQIFQEQDSDNSALFAKLRAAGFFGEEDPDEFGKFDSSGVVGSGTCMGGYILELDLYLDCQKLNGFLAIVSSDLSDVDRLATLEMILPDAQMPCPAGNCALFANNTNLENLNGLLNLVMVPGALSITSNEVLTSIQGLGDNLVLGTNDHNDAIEVRNNPLLRSLGHFDFEKSVCLDGGLTIQENSLLDQIFDYSTLLECIDGHLNIVNNDNLQVLGGIGNVTHVNGNVVISDNGGLDNLNDIILQHLGGALILSNNSKLGQIEGLLNVESVGANDDNTSIVIIQNPKISSVDALKNLVGDLQGAVMISGNDNLRNVDGLSHITSLGASKSGISLQIANNYVVESLEGFSSVNGSVPGAIEIFGNPSLKTLAGLQQISEIGSDLTGNALVVAVNARLRHLIGFEGLEKVHGAVVIEDNPQLEDVNALLNVKAVGVNALGVSIEITNNGHVLDLAGLGGLEGILEGSLVIMQNAELLSLDGTENIVEVGGLSIVDNSKLADINAMATLCMINGNVDISLNLEMESLDALAHGTCGAEGLTFNNTRTMLVDNVRCFSESDYNVFHSIVTEQMSTAIEGKHLDSSNRDITIFVEDVTTDAVRCKLQVTQVGKGDSNICGGVSTAREWQQWKGDGPESPSSNLTSHLYGTSGLYINIDTSDCDFDETPRYLASVVGDTAHWQLMGVNSIYKPTASGFRIYVFHPVLRGAYIKHYALRYNWKVSWMADMGRTSGQTLPGSTGWTKLNGADNALMLDINTKKSALQCPMYGVSGGGAQCHVRYVVSLQGEEDHWRVQGGHAIYNPTLESFRMFLVHPMNVTETYAENFGWSVAWVGSTDPVVSGISGIQWKPYLQPGANQPEDSIFIDVDASAGQYIAPPAYITSISGTAGHWAVTGAGSVINPTVSGFRIFLTQASSAEYAWTHRWRVNYIAVSVPTNCVMNEWSSFGACSASCTNGEGVAGTRTRERTIKMPAYFGGSCTDERSETETCTTVGCPVDCELAEWGPFSECNANCSLGTRTRTRQIDTAPLNGGLSCASTTETRSCEAGPCPVDCSVGEWGNWDHCTATCMTDTGVYSAAPTQVRLRYITTPPVSTGGACPALQESRECNVVPCPVDCVLANGGSWGAYGKCDKTCGWGLKWKERAVMTQPQHGGKQCPPTETMMPCYKGHCPVHCVMSAWGLWSSCDISCYNAGGQNMGLQRRYRSVLRYAQWGGTTCGDPMEHQECPDLKPCPVDCAVSDWAAWGTCSRSCSDIQGGIGTRTRLRNVTIQPNYGGTGCPPTEDTTGCNYERCSVDCEMHEWSAWGNCTRACGGGGSRRRARGVRLPMSFGGTSCPSAFEEDHSCADADCPVHCDVTEWTEWGGCTSSCGGGNRTRERDIVTEAENGGHVCPLLEDIETCGMIACPIDCLPEPWALWSGCTKTCGSGTRSRERGVIRAADHGGVACGVLHQLETCEDQHCPIDCVLQHWGPYSECAATCGAGNRTRYRDVLVPPMYGGRECDETVMYDACDAGPCPVHCEMSEWSVWGGCSRSCYNGHGSHPRRTRSRSIITHPQHGGFACPVEEDEESCSSQPCPVDCVQSAWSSWGPCSATCGFTGNRSKHRKTLVSAAHGGASCGLDQDWEDCGKVECPVDCTVGAWELWSSCSSSCGTGMHTRNRKIITAASAGGRACPELNQTTWCVDRPCPVHCEVSEWSSWSECSRTCDNGTQIKLRDVWKETAHGGADCPHLNETRPCGQIQCPVDCNMTEWSPWGSYSAGGAKVKRTRSIVSQPLHNGAPCGAVEERKYHYTDASMCKDEWVYGNWSECDKPCGTGHRYRYRYHVMCSRTAVIKYKMNFRQGHLCNIFPCTSLPNGELLQGTHHHVHIPALEAPANTVPENLIEQLDLEQRQFQPLVAGEWKLLREGEIVSAGIQDEDELNDDKFRDSESAPNSRRPRRRLRRNSQDGIDMAWEQFVPADPSLLPTPYM